jgi:hypothetical protein
VSKKQAQILDVKAYTRWSPDLEKCCLLVSANESYERTAADIEVLTGVRVSHSTQQRLVHRQTFDLPQVKQMVNEMSIDGGKVRLRTPQGQRARMARLQRSQSAPMLCRCVFPG